MKYQGGKYRFIKHITPIIQAEIDKHQARHFISPFCGACNIESAIVHTDKTCNDKNAYIIQMWQELQQGREFPSTVTEEQYKYVRDHKDEDPALTGFCGAGCSYAGTWFCGYARGRRGKNSPAKQNAATKQRWMAGYTAILPVKRRTATNA